MSDYFPVDTLVFVEVPNVPQVREDAKGTGLYALWSDDSMVAIRNFVEQQRASAAGHRPAPPPTDQEAPRELTEGYAPPSRRPAAWRGRAEGGDGALQVVEGEALLPKSAFEVVRMLLDFIESIEGGAALGLVDGAEGIEHLFVADLGANTGPAEALLESVYAEETADGMPPETVEISGVSVRISGVDGEHTAIADGMFFLGSKYAVMGALDRRGSGSNAGSLTASVNFTKAASFFPKGPYAYRVILDFPPLYARLKSLAAGVPQLDIQGFLDTMGLNDIETVSMVGALRLAGVVDHIYVSTRTADSRLIDMTGRTTLDEQRLSVVPRESLFFGARAADMKGAYEANIKTLSLLKGVLGMDLEALLEQFEQSAGVSIQKDIIPALGETSIGYVSLEGSTQLFAMLMGGGLRQVSLIEVIDEAAVQEALDKIIAYLQTDPQILGPTGTATRAGFQVETTTLGDMKVYSVVNPAAQFLSPSLAVTRGYLAYGDSKEALISAVDRIIAPAASILDHPDYIRARSALAKQAVQIAYLNLDAIVEIIYDNAFADLAKVVDAAHNRDEIPFSSADLPQAFRVKKHLDGIATGVTTSGNLIDFQVYSPFGLGAAVAAPAMALAASGPAEGPVPGLSQAGTESPERERLLEMGGLLQLSSIERYGRFPEKLTDVIPAEKLQAPQDPDPTSPIDYEYVAGLTAYSPGGRILVYERAGLQADGRHVLYVDGSVAFLTEEEFREAQGLPPAEDEAGGEEPTAEEAPEAEAAQ
ncbi:MAG: hypothetical protein ACYTAN_07765 [Planctomycetota bacterium]|jgi:hypothetical protein